MALNAIIKAEETIEKEKNEAIDAEHKNVWQGFYQDLSSEEAHAFYYALKEANYGVEEFIFKQGERNSNLYFIDFGQLKLIYTQKNDELLIKTLDAGSIAGEDTFFSIAICTSSLVTSSIVKLRVLEAKVFQRLEEHSPALTAKIERYCSKHPKVPELIKGKGIDRKEYRRVKITGALRFQILDASGKPMGNVYKGSLWDISAGGLSFYIKANRKNALVLLARQILVDFSLSSGQKKMKLEQTGKIVAVINHHFNSYSVHLKFAKMLEESLIDELDASPVRE
jgi:signal-transduction protein with cAMP-binding, CBS, and nucleotidyltransferase domain